MSKTPRNGEESMISTIGMEQISPRNVDDNLEYINNSYEDDSDSSSKYKETLHDHQQLDTALKQAATDNSQPRKILSPSFFQLAFQTEPTKTDDKPQDIHKTLFDMGFNSNQVTAWQGPTQPIKDDLYKLLRNMIDNQIQPNVKIRIGSATFKCHMMVLQCYSHFFMELTKEIFIRLPEEQVTAKAFQMIYEWMLADEPQIQREGFLELFKAGDFLQIKQLMDQCWLCLDDVVRFHEDTAFLLYLEARGYGLKIVQQLMLTRICKFFLTIVASTEFLSLNAEEICELLSLNTIGVHSEIEVFMSVVRWISHNWQEREPHLLDVIQCVRFSLIPVWFLVTLTSKTFDCAEIEQIVSNVVVMKMINDGITYNTIKSHTSENSKEFLDLLERFKLLAPTQRVWILDKDSKYQHGLKCPNMSHITYKSFLEYLQMIGTIGKVYWKSLEITKDNETGRKSSLDDDANKTKTSHLVIRSACQCRDQGTQCENGNIKFPDFIFPVKNHNDKQQLNDNSEINLKSKRNKNLTRPKPRRPLTYRLLTTTQCMKQQNVAETEIEKTVYFKNPHENHQRRNTSPSSSSSTRPPTPPRPQQKQRFRQQSENILYDNKNHHSTDMIRHIANCPAHSASNVMGATTTNSCCALIYKPDDNGVAAWNADIQSGDTLTEQDILNNDTQFLKRNNAGNGIIVVKKPVDEEDLMKWTRKSTLNVQLKCLINSKILLFGGMDPFFPHCQSEQQHQQSVQHQQRHQIKRLFTLDATNGHTTQPMGSHHPTKGINYAINGNGNASNILFIKAHVNNKFKSFGEHVLVYNADAMEWRHLSHIPFGGRHQHVVAVCNGLIYLIGGTRRSARSCSQNLVFEKSVWCFDPETLKWTLESSLPESRRNFAVISIDKKQYENVQESKDSQEHESGFYVIGGEGIQGLPLNTVWFYSVQGKVWIKKPSLNMGRYGLAAAMVNNEIWIAGGISNKNNSTDFTNGTGGHSNGIDGVATLVALNDEKTNAKLGTKAHVITDTIEIYTLKCSHEILANKDDEEEEGFENIYTAANGAGDGYAAFVAAILADDENSHEKGGVKAGPNVADGICDCNVGQWIKSKLHLRVARCFAKFCKMPNGELFLVGGAVANKQGDLTSLPDIDYFDVKQQKWQHYGDLNWPRHGHDVSLLNDHCFAVIGGVSTTSSMEKRSMRHVEVFCTKTRKCLKDLADLPWPMSGCLVATLK